MSSDLVGLLSIALAVGAGAGWLTLSSKSSAIATLKSDADRATNQIRALNEQLSTEKRKVVELTSAIQVCETQLKEERSVFEGRFLLFPWLAKAFSDLEELRGKREEQRLYNKSHPAAKAAEKVREYSKRASAAELVSRRLKYRLSFFESQFPWLSDFTDETLEEYLQNIESMAATKAGEAVDTNDPVSNFLADTEYSRLSPSDRNQLALDRWRRRKKSSWELGRDYERYVGYSLEQDGYSVEYFGAIEGFDDLGRDLIAKRKGETRIIQCKYWSRQKEIHEKHIFQIFGSVVEYIAREKMGRDSASLFSHLDRFTNVAPELVTSTNVSLRARDFATILGVRIREDVPLGEYPLIKCNIARRTGEKVYHLPFDQQYDRTRIESDKGESYASTVGDAEALGFRRAFRWRPERSD